MDGGSITMEGIRENIPRIMPSSQPIKGGHPLLIPHNI